MQQAEILIVGAGPTGLVLALTLAKKGVPFRIIDNDPGPGNYSRALVVHARTLEFYRALGFADAFVAKGVKIELIKLRARSQPFVDVSFADIGRGQSPFPFSLGLPQDEHEEFLVARLRDLGIAVDWGVELKGLKQTGEQVEVQLMRGSSPEQASCSYVCGCDGASSKVRTLLAVPFSGGTYDDLFFVADAELERAPDADISVNLGSHSFALVTPIRTSGMYRIVGLVPHRLRHERNLAFEDVRADSETFLDMKVRRLNWFSTYRVHHRVADRFQIGRCFLLGDAGHVHSPAGGQGMNTGIGDAFNLAWKLAEVVAKGAEPKLLESYEVERSAFARKLVASTDRAFEILTATGGLYALLRTWVIPGLMGHAMRFARVRSMMFKLISQTRIRYRASPLSQGQAGGIYGGDRLPWIPAGATDNFVPLQSLDWQVHVYGTAEPAFEREIARLGLELHRFAFDEIAAGQGAARDAAYLIRPDGYVGVAQSRQDAGELETYLASVGARKRNAAAASAKRQHSSGVC